MLLMIDNYDSFTYNLVQYFQRLGQQVVVVRNDQASVEELAQLNPQFLVISPGPCTPNEAGVSMAAITHFAGKIPILGVCLGHQAIAQAFGGKVVLAPKVMHGKTSQISHTNVGVFKGLNNPLTVTRYHSLCVDIASLPQQFEITAWLDEHGQRSLMAMRHRSMPIESVQFHPEAILTEQGLALLANFVEQ